MKFVKLSYLASRSTFWSLLILWWLVKMRCGSVWLSKFSTFLYDTHIPEDFILEPLFYNLEDVSSALIYFLLRHFNKWTCLVTNSYWTSMFGDFHFHPRNINQKSSNFYHLCLNSAPIFSGSADTWSAFLVTGSVAFLGCRRLNLGRRLLIWLIWELGHHAWDLSTVIEVWVLHFECFIFIILTLTTPLKTQT